LLNVITGDDSISAIVFDDNSIIGIPLAKHTLNVLI
jgi:hypothetical protein